MLVIINFIKFKIIMEEIFINLYLYLDYYNCFRITILMITPNHPLILYVIINLYNTNYYDQLKCIIYLIILFTLYVINR